MQARILLLVSAALALAPLSGACGGGDGGGAGSNVPAPSETGEPKGPGSEPPGGGQEPGTTGTEPTGGGYESPSGSSSGASSSSGGSSGGSSSGGTASGGPSSSGGVATDCPVCMTYSCTIVAQGQTTMASITLQSVASPSGACSVSVDGTTYVLLCGGKLEADDDAGSTGVWGGAGTSLTAAIDGTTIVCL
jgi:hypothetical protein